MQNMENRTRKKVELLFPNAFTIQIGYHLHKLPWNVYLELIASSRPQKWNKSIWYFKSEFNDKYIYKKYYKTNCSKKYYYSSETLLHLFFKLKLLEIITRTFGFLKKLVLSMLAACLHLSTLLLKLHIFSFFPFSAVLYSSAGKETKQHSSLLLLNKELPRTGVTIFLVANNI